MKAEVIRALEAKGMKRWTNYGKDRLYLDRGYIDIDKDEIVADEEEMEKIVNLIEEAKKEAKNFEENILKEKEAIEEITSFIKTHKSQFFAYGMAKHLKKVGFSTITEEQIEEAKTTREKAYTELKQLVENKANETGQYVLMNETATNELKKISVVNFGWV